MVRVNDKIAEATRRDRQDAATFICECGRCSGDFVPLSMDDFDQHRAREEPVFAPGH